MQKSKILLCGGGTLGPVTPLLAIVEAWRKSEPALDFVFVGTPHGPERELIERAEIKFISLPEAKLQRYPSLEWLGLPFRMVAALLVAQKILRRERPGLIVSAGGYTAVPLIVVGWFLKIPSWTHQQDVRAILSNKLSAPFASLITVAWKENLKDFSSKKTQLVGNPVREAFLKVDREVAVRFFDLDSSRPTILVLGGGTGSLWLNNIIDNIGDKILARANIIHLTGKGKTSRISQKDNYKVFELLTKEMPLAFAAADLVVCRAGLGTITELAATKKAAIIIPLPKSPQEDNAAAVVSASVVLQQQETDGKKLLEVIVKLLDDEEKRKQLGRKMNEVLKTDVAEQMISLAEKLIVSR